MRRAEAEKLIGKRVQGTISNWGTYAGTLVGITDDKPFRARIRVEEILELPTPYLGAEPHRKKKKPPMRIPYPIEEGKIIEVSEYLMEPYPYPRRDYMETLKGLIKEKIAEYQKEIKRIKEVLEKFEKQGYLRNERIENVMIIGYASKEFDLNRHFPEYLKRQIRLREKWLEILHIWMDYYFGGES